MRILFFLLISLLGMTAVCGMPCAAPENYGWRHLTAELRREFPQERPHALAEIARAVLHREVVADYFQLRTDRARKLIRLWNHAVTGQNPGNLRKILPLFRFSPCFTTIIRSFLIGLPLTTACGAEIQSVPPCPAPEKCLLTPLYSRNSPLLAELPSWCALPENPVLPLSAPPRRRTSGDQYSPEEARRQPILPAIGSGLRPPSSRQ